MNRVEYVYYQTNKSGYEIWVDNKTDTTVATHQLVAIANGANPEKVFSGGDWHCHHKNGIPWDNRHSNLELLSSSEHSSLHIKEKHEKNIISPQKVSKEKLKSLRWEERLTHAEIAEQLDLTESTVINHIRNYGLGWDQQGPDA